MLERASESTQVGKMELEKADIVIIGNGIAGLTAALEARQLAPDKHIVIITDQLHPTINTPSLKQFAIAKLTREQLMAYPAGTEHANRIHVVTGHVEEIHARSKYVKLSGGYAFGYGSLLIATGGVPQGLSEDIPGRDFDGVLTLHRLQDYLNLRRRIGEVAQAVVIGGGVHAIETVMGLHYWGIHVHWLLRGSTFMRNTLDESSSNMVLSRIRRNGITIHTETEVIGIVGRVGAVVGVITNLQEMIPCQLVLTCTGTRASTKLAKSCTIPIQEKQGIIVDDKLRSSVRDIYAAGDVAALLNPQTGKYETRAQWYAAVHQGRIAAAMLADQSEQARQPFGVSWHATQLGDLSMLSVGEPLSKDPRVTLLTDNSQGGYRRIAVLDNRLVGYLALGAAQPDSLALKRIIDEGHTVRDITKSLLKGNFDSQQYLAKLRTSATEKIVTARKLPVASSYAETGTWTTGKHPSIAALSPKHNSNLLPELPDNYITLASSISQHDSGEYDASWQEPEEINQFDELNAFTGTLPALADIDQSTWSHLFNQHGVHVSLESKPAAQLPQRNLWSFKSEEQV